MTDTAWLIRPALPEDYAQWRVLYAGYADFYRVTQTDDMANRGWGWICDPGHEVRCLLAVEGDGAVAGLAHYRPFARPLAASTGCFLDDLFVPAQARGRGAVDALLAALKREARDNGWNVVRWITADDNYRARAKYDQVAERTSWITYDMSPEV